MSGDRRRIFTTDPRDVAAAVMAELGYGDEFITKRTGLSTGKIAYRLKYAGIKRANYRTGRSKTAQMVLNRMDDQVGEIVERRVQYVAGKRHGKGGR